MYKRIVFVTLVVLIAGLTALILIAKRSELSEGVAGVGVQPISGSLSDLDFTLFDENNKPVTISNYAGRIIVLEWTNYDCPFVRDHYESERMQALAQNYIDQGVVWIAVNSTNYAGVAANKRWSQEQNLTYHVLDDSQGVVGKKFRAVSTPHMFIFDKQGQLVYNGAIDNKPIGRKPVVYTNYVDQVLAQLLKGDRVTFETTKPYGCPVKYR